MKLYRLALCATLSLSHPALHGAHAASLPVPVPAGPLTGVLTDVGADGVVWARAASYKARFGRGGVEFGPVVGARAPSGAPLFLRLESASLAGRELALDRDAPPRLEGDVVRYGRGALRERYALSSDGVEQDFVFHELPGEGELLLRIAVATARTGREEGGALLFDATSAALGTIRYSHAITRDARGRTVAHPALLVDGGIELRVPAEFLSGAELPLVVDPVLQAIDVDSSPRVARDPDVAFDGTGEGTWLVVYEDATDAGDTDLIARRFDTAGTLLEELAVDLSADDTVDPAVAGANGQFLVAWTKLAAGPFSPQRIRARFRSASAPTQGAAFDVSAGGATNEERADVGAPHDGVAGEGAKMALLSMQERHAGLALLDEVDYVELSDRADFNDLFIEQLAFPS